MGAVRSTRARLAAMCGPVVHGAGHTLAAAIAFAYPQLCPGCGAAAGAGQLLCEHCHARIPRIAFPLCARCLSRGADGAPCAAHPHHRVWAAWVYDERAAAVVHALKYSERDGLAAALGAELARAVPARPRPDLIVEVLLHAARRRERGYNQAGLLAAALGEALAVPHLAGALERVRPTRPQARLDPRGRRANVAGAFRAVTPAALKGRNVLIVDDVLTTGSTLDACLDALADAGANAAGVTLAWAQ